MDNATSLIKALDLMTLLGGSRAGYTVQELSAAMDLPRSTVVRILNTLVWYGLIAKEEKRYFCTEAFTNWTTQDRHRAFRLFYRAILERVATATDELVLLGLQDGAGVVHIDYIESDQRVRVAPAPQTRHNIRRNAIGKLCLAARPDLAKRWTDAEPALAEELAEVRACGVAWNREESVPGMIAMACYGRSRAATEPKIAVAWPVSRFSPEKGAQAIQAIQEALAQEN